MKAQSSGNAVVFARGDLTVTVRHASQALIIELVRMMAGGQLTTSMASVIVPDAESEAGNLEPDRSQSAVDSTITPPPDRTRARITGALPKPELGDVGTFLAECCLIGPEHWAPVGAVLASYRAWCARLGLRALNQRGLFLELLRLGLCRNRARRIDGRQTRTWEGARLITVNGALSLVAKSVAGL